MVSWKSSESDPSAYDFEVQAASDQLEGGMSWVAVGFSRGDADMGGDTVLMFNSHTGEVELYWNDEGGSSSSAADPDNPGVEAGHIAYTSSGDPLLYLYGLATRAAALEFVLPPTSDDAGEVETNDLESESFYLLAAAGPLETDGEYPTKHFVKAASQEEIDFTECCA